ncbi:MAG: hypothetical protein H6700_02555 [Myxococcales bacterium]|nr:hypothetical protein [Myxococcales bacterium]MCB9530620.1 hypothetical protein [Myxococcales bacterium]
MDRFVSVRRIGLLAVLLASLAAAPDALRVLWTATTTLFANEGAGRFTAIAGSTREVSPDRTGGGAEGRLVSVTGRLEASEPVGDPELFVPGRFASVTREVETYAWVERVTERSRAVWGGGREVERVVTYEQAWTSTVVLPGGFEHPEGHENPTPRWSTLLQFPEAYRIGAWSVDPGESIALGGRTLARGDVGWTDVGATLSWGADGWAYSTAEAEQRPALGAQRLRWMVVDASAEHTAFGRARGGRIEPIEWFDGISLVAVVPGTRSDALAVVSALDGVVRWVVRIGGFFAVAWSFATLLSPIAVVASIVPPVGFVARITVGVFASVAALLWTLAVIGLSQVGHSPGLMVLLALALLLAARVWWGERGHRRYAA